MATVTVSAKGWVVIPAEYRRKYNVRSGSEVEVVDFGGGMSLVPLLQHPVREAQGLLKRGKGLAGALLVERAKERKREAVR
jgi:AbrB family looped-hinge helix DNA binding protein